MSDTEKRRTDFIHRPVCKTDQQQPQVTLRQFVCHEITKQDARFSRTRRTPQKIVVQGVFHFRQGSDLGVGHIRRGSYVGGEDCLWWRGTAKKNQERL